MEGKAAAILTQAFGGLEGSRRSRFTGFLDSRHMKLARLSYLTHRPLCPSKYPWFSFLLASESTPEGLTQWKIQRPECIEPATLHFVAHCLNELRTAFVRRVIPNVELSVCLKARLDFTISTSSQYDQYYATGWHSKAIILIFNNNMADALNFEGEWHRRHLFQDPDVYGNRSLREKWVSLGWCCWRENWVFIYASSAVGLEAGTNKSFSWLFNKLYR